METISFDLVFVFIKMPIFALCCFHVCSNGEKKDDFKSFPGKKIQNAQ